jgi:flagellar biosynthesis chaperone FliJ
MFDSARDIAETTAENVSTIGNALKRDGIVQRDSYSEMAEDVRGTNKFINKLERLDNKVSAISSVSSDLVSIKDDWKDLKEERDDFKKLVDESKKKTKDENETIDKEVDKLPDISEKDEREGEDS